jgi:sulfite reductase (NADPH) flavoprotein alpha-component
MLAELKLNSFRELLKNVSKEELIWMNGYLSALINDENTSATPSVAEKVSKESSLSGCTVVYGTETGNSKKVATDFSSRLKKQGVQSKVKSLDQYRITDLSKESCLLVVMSTQGDGEPPAAAKKFYDYLYQNEVKLDHLKYGVLALGDSAYPLFCKAGEDVDIRLQQLGAQRIMPLGKCDSDFEEDANQWLDNLITASLQSASSTNSTAKVVTNTKPGRTGKKIYNGTILTHINLNDRGSNKETYHIEIATEEPILYEPGDSIGLVAKNKQTAVTKLLQLLEIEANEVLHYKDASYTAEELFTSKINIQHLPERIVQSYAKLVKKEIPSIRIDLVDLMRIYPFDGSVNMEQLLSILDPIAPRLYSISSSPAAHGDSEVHITVSKCGFTVDGHKRFGLCSDYLSGLNEGDTIQLYVQKNNSFRLPAHHEDVIMIGPGTGIAPFRSFLMERDAQGAEGRNWLFFGEQHFVSDFLYQTELQTLFETGVLTKVNTAFSRDQKEKVYVQHRMIQRSNELFEWINGGAHIYVCGAKDPMSTDVENTLASIVANEGNMALDAAREYLHNLHEAGRYHKDVY